MDSDLANAQRIAEEVRASEGERTWRKVTTLLDAFGAYRLTPEVRQRIGDALEDAGVDVRPPLDVVARYETVRLAIPDAEAVEEESITGRTRILSVLMPIDEAVTVTEWSPGEAPTHHNLFALTKLGPDRGMLWIDMDVSGIEAEELLPGLQPHCPGLEAKHLAALFRVDALPRVARAGERRELRFVTAFASRAEEPSGVGSDAESAKTGELEFQIVEFLAGEDWLISTWHRSQRYLGAERILEGRPRGRAEVLEAVTDEWTHGAGETVGDLGTLALTELVRTYRPTSRTLRSWLDQWELDFHRRLHRTERETLMSLRSLLGELETRLISLDRPDVDPARAWFTGLTQPGVASRVSGRISRSLADVRALDGALRGSLDVLGVYSTAEQLRLAQQQSERSKNLEWKLTAVGAILIAPSIIADLYGGNTRLPGPHSELTGLAWVLLLMVSFAVIAYFMIRRDTGESEPAEEEEEG